MPGDLRWNVYKFSEKEGLLIAEGLDGNAALAVANEVHWSRALGEWIVVTPIDAAIFSEVPSLASLEAPPLSAARS